MARGLTRGTVVLFVRAYELSFYTSWMKILDVFRITNIVFLFCLSFPLHNFQNSCIYTHTHSYRFQSTLDLTDNNSATANYDFENPINLAEDEGEDDCEVPGELARLLLQEERAIQPHEEPVETVNLGTETDRKEVKIGANLELSVKQRLIQMLHDYVEIFSWSYEDMPGLDTDIVVHHLPTKEELIRSEERL